MGPPIALGGWISGASLFGFEGGVVLAPRSGDLPEAAARPGN